MGTEKGHRLKVRESHRNPTQAGKGEPGLFKGLTAFDRKILFGLNFSFFLGFQPTTCPADFRLASPIIVYAKPLK